MKRKFFIIIFLCLAIGFLTQLPGDALSQEGTGTPQAPPTATLPPPPNSRPTIAPPPPTTLPPTMPQPTALPSTMPPPNPRPDGLPSLTPSPTSTIIGNTPTLPTATLPPTQDGWILYNDNDLRLQYSDSGWQQFDVPAATGGTLTATKTAGATLTIEFEGTGIALLYSQGPEGGDFSVQLDDNLPLRATSQADTYTYSQRLEWTDLPTGPHTLTVTNGFNALWIEAVEVEGWLLEPSTVQVTTQPLPPNAYEVINFAQDFDTAGGLAYTLVGEPNLPSIGMPTGYPSNTAIEETYDISDEQIKLEVTLSLGGEYTVTGYSYYVDLLRHLCGGLGCIYNHFTDHLITVEFLDSANSEIVTIEDCRYWPEARPTNCGGPTYLASPISGVSTMRFSHFSEGPITYAVDLTLLLDNLEIYTSSGTPFTPVPPTDTPVPPSLTPTATPDPSDPYPPLDTVHCVEEGFDPQVMLALLPSQTQVGIDLGYGPNYPIDVWEYWDDYEDKMQQNPSLATLATDTRYYGNYGWEQETLEYFDPANYGDIPDLCRIEFGVKGILEELAILKVANTNPNFPEFKEMRIKVIGLQEAAGGYEYGRGYVLYELTSSMFTMNRWPTLSDTEIKMAAIIVWHEGSEDQYGTAFNIMGAWAVYNVLRNTYFTDSVTGNILYERTLESWKGTKEGWIKTASGTTYSDLIEWRHNDLMASSQHAVAYTAAYQAAKRAAEDYSLGLPDPVNRGAGLSSDPLRVISYSLNNFIRVTPGQLSEGIDKYNDKVKGHHEEIDQDTGEPTWSVQHFLMFRGTFVRVEPGNLATTLTNWRMLIWDDNRPEDFLFNR